LILKFKNKLNNKFKMNIAISGPMCSGKTTIANLLKLINNDFKIYSFGQKIKDIAHELFNMNKNYKDRSLIINIADKMRDIDPDVWAKYTIKQTKEYNYCIIDDLRFQNELDLLEKENDWIYIVLNINESIRLSRLKKLYPDNFQDHIKNMSHLSEKGQLNFKNKKNVMYINSNDSLENIKYNIKYFINNYK
jgi:cytidylate kinase